MAENESMNVSYSKIAAISCSIDLSSIIVERREVFISFSFENLRSADATVIGAVNKMRKLFLYSENFIQIVAAHVA